MKITYYENFSQKPKELIESKHTFIVVLQVYVTIGALEKALLTALLRMPLTTRWLRISPRFSNGLIGFRFEVYGCSSEKQLFSFEGKTNIDSSNKGAWNGKKYASRRIFVQFLRSRSLIFFSVWNAVSESRSLFSRLRNSRARKKYVSSSRSLGFTIRYPFMRQ